MTSHDLYIFAHSLGGTFENTLSTPGYSLISDDVRHTLNYAEVYQIVSEEMKHSCNLLEKVAGNIGSHLIQAFPLIQAIDLQITKVNPPMGADCKGAGVEVHLINDKSGV